MLCRKVSRGPALPDAVQCGGGGIGNLNWPARTSCNRKSCEKPRPLLPAGPGAGIGGQMIGAGGVSSAMLSQMQMAAQAAVTAGYGMPGYSMPGAQALGGGMAMQQPGTAVGLGGMLMGLGGGGGYGGMLGAGGMGIGGALPAAAPAAAGDSGAPPGSWVCASCQNVNFPNRTVCNRRSCGLPRS